MVVPMQCAQQQVSIHITKSSKIICITVHFDHLLYVQPQPLPALHHQGAGAGGEGGGQVEAPEPRAPVPVPVLLPGGEEGEQRRAAGEHARPGIIA